ncbi:hypothetical protein [Rheinheimera sp. NSM]|uniref:hypothetical protein n=1 Tax=Rheinheimera sp. NSM TaxID=3457884 RepID=UPI00403654C9
MINFIRLLIFTVFIVALLSCSSYKQAKPVCLDIATLEKVDKEPILSYGSFYITAPQNRGEIYPISIDDFGETHPKFPRNDQPDGKNDMNVPPSYVQSDIYKPMRVAFLISDKKQNIYKVDVTGFHYTGGYGIQPYNYEGGKLGVYYSSSNQNQNETIQMEGDRIGGVYFYGAETFISKICYWVK